MRDGRWKEWGRLAEREARRLLEANGWRAIPQYAIEDNGAPMLTGRADKTVLADIQAFKEARGAWFEVKLKDHCDVYQKGGIKCESINAPPKQWQQGIDLPNWRHYQQLEHLTGMPTHLMMIQIKPGAAAEPDPVIIWQSVEELRKCAQVQSVGNRTFPRGVAYFPMPSFMCRRVDFVAPPDFLAQQRNENPWERRSKAGLAPAWKIVCCDESPFVRQRRGSCECCDAPGLFGYNNKDGTQSWYCAAHKRFQFWADARREGGP